MNRKRHLQKDARNGNYIVQIRRNGVRRYFTLGTDEAEARTRLKLLERDVAAGRVDFEKPDTSAVVRVDGKKDMRIEELAVRHLEWVQKNLAPGTLRNRQGYVNQFLEFIGGVMVSEITRQKLAEFHQQAKDTRGRGENGGNEALAGIKAMLRWGEEQELYDLPFKRFPKMAHIQPEIVPLDDGEFDKLLGAAPPDFRDMLLFGLLTGLRPGELRGLTRNAIRRMATGDTYVYIWKHKTTKTARSPKPRTVALCADAQQIVERQARQHPQSAHVFVNADGNPYGRFTYRNRLRRLCAKLGLRNMTPYLLRHTFATWESEAGVETTALSQMMGHTTTRTLERYVSNTHEHHKKAVEAIAERVRNRLVKVAV